MGVSGFFIDVPPNGPPTSRWEWNIAALLFSLISLRSPKGQAGDRGSGPNSPPTSDAIDFFRLNADLTVG